VPTDDPHDAGTARVLAGIVVGGTVVPAHVAEAVERILAEPGVEAIVLAAPPAARPGRPRPGMAFRAYQALDRRVFRPALDPHRRVRLTVPLAGDLPPALDVLILLDGTTAPAELAGRARLGTWSFGHDSGAAAAFWPLASGATTVTTTLVETGPDGRSLERYRSIGPVDRFSLARTEAPLRWKAATFPARSLAAVRREGWTAVEDPAGTQRAEPGPVPTRELPSGPEMVGFLARLALRIARRVAQRLVGQNEWFVAYRRRVPGAPLPTSLRGFIPIEAPTGTFYADPFILADGDRHRLFVEAYSRTTALGTIAELPLDEAIRGPWPAVPVLERPYHLSYPFLLRDDDGSLLLVPESGDHGTTTAYRPADDGTWLPDGTVLDGITAYDPTLLHRDGTHWLFVAVTVRGGSPWDELCLFYGPSVRGPWTPHPANPIVTDVRSARPAGRIFEHDGHLLRPAQDCAGAYGRRVVLQEIIRLDREGYEERPWSSIEPTGIRGVLRTHTYTRDGDFEALDGFRHRRRTLPRPRRSAR
jgi:hypothetical protein